MPAKTKTASKPAAKPTQALLRARAELQTKTDTVVSAGQDQANATYRLGEAFDAVDAADMAWKATGTKARKAMGTKATLTTKKAKAFAKWYRELGYTKTQVSDARTYYTKTHNLDAHGIDARGLSAGAMREVPTNPTKAFAGKLGKAIDSGEKVTQAITKKLAGKPAAGKNNATGSRPTADEQIVSARNLAVKLVVAAAKAGTLTKWEKLQLENAFSG